MTKTELNFPLNIHSRSTGRHTVALLLERDAVKVHPHAFDGSENTA
jgi:TatD DNase family protein